MKKIFYLISMLAILPIVAFANEQYVCPTADEAQQIAKTYQIYDESTHNWNGWVIQSAYLDPSLLDGLTFVGVTVASPKVVFPPIQISSSLRCYYTSPIAEQGTPMEPSITLTHNNLETFIPLTKTWVALGSGWISCTSANNDVNSCKFMKSQLAK